jgi:phenylalanyl-tRNA synthetase beta chain
VKLPADLIEEIGRLYGYQNIPEEFPTGELSFPEKNPNIFWGDKVKDILKELGFSEIYNYSFINPEQANLFNYSEKDLISTKNPISAEYQYLRPSLIPNLIENVKVQLKDFDSFKTFELGKVFKKTKERRDLSGLIVGDQKEYFYELKGLIDNLFEKVGVTDYYFDNYQATPEESNINIWDIERAAEIKINNKEIGFLGYISKEILKKMGIKKDVIVFDINFDLLQKLMTEENEYQPISPYPTAVRDLSILVPHQVKVVEVLNIINRIGKELVVDVDLFDIYNEFSKNQKSLAFHIIYQSQEKTLSSKEIDRLHNKIVKKLEKNINWEVRK